MSKVHFLAALCMLFLIELRILVPVFNSHSIELDPGHTHIVIGAKNSQEAEAVLLAHLHGNGTEHASERSASISQPASGGPRVVSLADQVTGQAAAFGFDTQAVLISNRLSFTLPLASFWLILPGAFTFPSGNKILPQDPPPELFV
jgi:hypothetical protein